MCQYSTKSNKKRLPEKPPQGRRRQNKQMQACLRLNNHKPEKNASLRAPFYLKKTMDKKKSQSKKTQNEAIRTSSHKKHKAKRYAHSGEIESIAHLIFENDAKRQLKLF